MHVGSADASNYSEDDECYLDDEAEETHDALRDTNPWSTAPESLSHKNGMQIFDTD